MYTCIYIYIQTCMYIKYCVTVDKKTFLHIHQEAANGWAHPATQFPISATTGRSRLTGFGKQTATVFRPLSQRENMGFLFFQGLDGLKAVDLGYTETNSSHLPGCAIPKEMDRIVFRPSLFRFEFLVSGYGYG